MLDNLLCKVFSAQNFSDRTATIFIHDGMSTLIHAFFGKTNASWVQIQSETCIFGEPP